MKVFRKALVLLCLWAPQILPAAEVGEQLFGAHCSRCHTTTEIEKRIRNDWAGRTANLLFERTRSTMPGEAPGTLADSDYLELLDYMFTVAGVAPAPESLTAGSLKRIVIQLKSATELNRKEIPWRTSHGELNANRYSPADQINADNASQLQITWRWNAANIGPVAEIRNVSNPIMRHGQLFLGAGITRNIVSLNAQTGQLLWLWRPDEGERFEQAARKGSGMGVAYWEAEDGRRRVITVTPGYFLVSLNAATGLPDPDFGAGGWVDLTQGLRRAGSRKLDIGLNAPPLVVGNVIVVGSAHAVSFRPRSMRNVKGDVRGFDARTGELLWTFHTIPETDEPGYETWHDNSAEYTGNASVWAPMSADEKLGLVYLPIESATGDRYGGDRHGENLYANSLVALDVRTGKMRWHYQLIHHDIWDWDTPTAPVLANLPDGRQLVVQPTKQAFAYVFDRQTGKPVWPIVERPVPQTDVPGEWTSPTQPIPTKPAPFDRQGVTADDLIDYTPEIRRAIEALTSTLRLGPLFTPPSLASAEDGTVGTIGMPYSTGGANFEGSGYDPETGVIFIPSQSRTNLLALEHVPDESDIRYIAVASDRLRIMDLPIIKPPWGRITAIDLQTGDHMWSIANGDTPADVLNNPALDGVDLPRTGKQTRAGIVVTKTLLFAGEGFGGDPVFRAHNKKTGEIIAEISLPATQSSPPSTYMLNGRQYIVMTVADGKSPAELIALALPKSDL